MKKSEILNLVRPNFFLVVYTPECARLETSTFPPFRTQNPEISSCLWSLKVLRPRILEFSGKKRKTRTVHSSHVLGGETICSALTKKGPRGRERAAHLGQIYTSLSKNRKITRHFLRRPAEYMFSKKGPAEFPGSRRNILRRGRRIFQGAGGIYVF